MASTTQVLAGLHEGSRAVIDAVPFEDGVDDFAALRLLPGETIEVVQVIPLGGPLLIRTRSGFYALGRLLAERVWVRT
ncbi:MAG TPA: FeoA family protein [bacterium]